VQKLALAADNELMPAMTLWFNYAWHLKQLNGWLAPKLWATLNSYG
jgi:hypothetical protein